MPTWTKTTLRQRRRPHRFGETRSAARRRSASRSSAARISSSPPSKTGLASLTASMMSEGTKTQGRRGALERAAAARHVGLDDGRRRESGSMSFVSTTDKFGPTLDIVADMLLNSTFPADALERLRAQRLVALTQARAQPGAIAGRVFPKVLYGNAHPYGRVATEASLKAITRDDVVAFHNRSTSSPAARSSRWSATSRPPACKPVIEKALAAWPKAGSRPAFYVPGAAAGAEDDDLPRRSTGRRAVDLRDWPSRTAAQHAGLLRAAGHEHDARRHVPVAARTPTSAKRRATATASPRTSRLARAREPSAPAATSSATRPTSRSSSS